MPLPTVITDLSPVVGTGPAPNGGQPGGGESPSTFDDYMRAYGAFIAQLRDGPGFTVAVRSNALGSVTVPAFSFVGDTDTGVFSPGANVLAATTGGTERMRIDTAGNVGIGRAPTGAAVLDIQSAASAIVRVRGGTGTNQGSAVYGTVGSDTTTWAIGARATIYGGTPGNDSAVYSLGTLSLGTAAVERMTIDAAGNVGIGTASPASRLNVVNTSAGDGVIVRSNGFNTNLTGSINALVIGCDSNTATSYVISGGSSTNTTLAFFTAATAAPVERMRIDSSGNVGIGATPSSWNSVWSAVDIGPYGSIASERTAASQLVLGWNVYGTGAASYAYRRTGDVARLFDMDTNGFRWSTAPSGTAGNAITFTERMRIDASGNVGIGTASPTVPCDVAGAIRTRAVTVAALPAAATAGAGSRHFVTDATATTFAAVVAGGGANGVPVYSDGTNWRIG